MADKTKKKSLIQTRGYTAKSNTCLFWSKSCWAQYTILKDKYALDYSFNTDFTSHWNKKKCINRLVGGGGDD